MPGILPPEPSKQQRKVLDWVLKRIRERGIPPSLQEIGDALSMDPAAVFRHLKLLERKGYIERDRTARSLRPTAKAYLREEQVGFPLVGEVAAGVPILAQENIEGYVPIDAALLPRGRVDFLLRVKGDSMVGAGIHDRDLIMVRKQDHAEPGDVVIALLDDEATVKRLRRKGRKTWLEGENPRREWKEPLGKPGRVERIVGKGVGLVRVFEP